MTKEELSRLYNLNREIEAYFRKLERLEAAADSCVPILDGMPRARGASDRVSRYASEIHDLKALIDCSVQECFCERSHLEHYIQTVKDSEIRMILSLKYINGLSFRQIAFSLGYREESVPRKKHNEFLKMTEISERAVL